MYFLRVRDQHLDDARFLPRLYLEAPATSFAINNPEKPRPSETASQIHSCLPGPVESSAYTFIMVVCSQSYPILCIRHQLHAEPSRASFLCAQIFDHPSKTPSDAMSLSLFAVTQPADAGTLVKGWTIDTLRFRRRSPCVATPPPFPYRRAHLLTNNIAFQYRPFLRV